MIREYPLQPRRAARARRMTRCSSLSVTMVRVSSLRMVPPFEVAGRVRPKAGGRSSRRAFLPHPPYCRLLAARGLSRAVVRGAKRVIDDLHRWPCSGWSAE